MRMRSRDQLLLITLFLFGCLLLYQLDKLSSNSYNPGPRSSNFEISFFGGGEVGGTLVTRYFLRGGGAQDSFSY